MDYIVKKRSIANNAMKVLTNQNISLSENKKFQEISNQLNQIIVVSISSNKVVYKQRFAILFKDKN